LEKLIFDVAQGLVFSLVYVSVLKFFDCEKLIKTIRSCVFAPRSDLPFAFW